MKPQFINQITPSFIHFLDHELLARGSAYTNISGALYTSSDPDLKGCSLYASPYRQFVSDSSIVGANIPSGIYVNGSFRAKNTSGIFIDYGMGRAGTVGATSFSNVTCAYAYKDYNIYYAESQDETLIFETKYPVRPEDFRGNTSNTALPFDSTPYPAVFVKIQWGDNVPYAFGGQDESFLEMRCIFLADSPYLLDAGLSIATDSARKVFPMLHLNDLPFNQYGDLKTGTVFDYNALCAQYSVTGSLWAIIDSVKISKFTPAANKIIGNNVYGGFADFMIKYVRNPRVY